MYSYHRCRRAVGISVARFSAGSGLCKVRPLEINIWPDTLYDTLYDSLYDTLCARICATLCARTPYTEYGVLAAAAGRCTRLILQEGSEILLYP